MQEKFVKAVVDASGAHYTLELQCVNGATVTLPNFQISLETLYADGSSISVGDTLMYSRGSDDILLPPFYPYGNPQGDPTRHTGGKGKGQIQDIEQRPVLGLRANMLQNSNTSKKTPINYGTEGRGVVTEWINGIPMNVIISNINDPAFAFIPNGTDVFFHASYDPDGNLQIDYLSLSEGDNADPE